MPNLCVCRICLALSSLPRCSRAFCSCTFYKSPMERNELASRASEQEQGTLCLPLSLYLSVESVQFDNGREVVRLRLLRYRSSGFNFLIWRCVDSRKVLKMRAGIYPHSSCVQLALTATTGQSQEWRSERGDGHRRRYSQIRPPYPTSLWDAFQVGGHFLW